MDFAERFKGRTNKISKLGTLSILSESKIPVEKAVVTPLPLDKIPKPKSEVESPRAKIQVQAPKLEKNIFRKAHSEKNIIKRTPRSVKTVIVKKQKENEKMPTESNVTEYGTLKSARIEKASSQELPELSSYSLSPDPIRKSQNGPYLFNLNRPDLSVRNENQQILLFSQRIFDMLHSNKPLLGEYSPGLKGTRDSKISTKVSSLNELRESFQSSRRNFNEHTTDATKLMSMSFIDRQQRMVEKYGMKSSLNMEPEAPRIQKLLSFNY